MHFYKIRITVKINACLLRLSKMRLIGECRAVNMQEVLEDRLAYGYPFAVKPPSR